MRWLILALGLCLVAVGLYPRPVPLPPPLALTPSPATLRETARGPVTGGVAASGAWVWLGIPYAAPPTGERRWRAPRPPVAWAEPREALDYGPVCPQFASRLSAVDAEPGTLVGDEDCLSLNVFAPGGSDDRSALPVMVFIHGGGNTIGSARPYDASRLASEQGLLVVTLNYRLGPLGWLSHPALRAAAADERDASGNFALLDIHLALEWVRDNIRVFGGDPDRVTLFGESAGAQNLYGLLASPEGRGLFHGAILQSGRAGTSSLARAEAYADDLQPGHPNSSRELLLDWLQESGVAGDRTSAREALERLSMADTMTFMRSLSIEELLAPLTTPGGMYRLPTLFRDGVVLPEKPLLEVFADPGTWNRVPVLAGSNRDEMKLFLALSERHTVRRFGLFPTPREPEAYQRLARYHSRQWKAVGVDEPLARMQQADPELPLFVYRFDWDAMRSGVLIDLPELLGAAHALELDFLFGPLIGRVVHGVLYPGNIAGFEQLGRTLRDYWAGFAYSGRPGGGRSSAHTLWPVWQAGEPQLLVLDEAGDGGVRVERSSVRMADVKAELAADADLGARERCALYVDLFLANGGLEDYFEAREYQSLGCAQFPAWGLAGTSR